MQDLLGLRDSLGSPGGARSRLQGGRRSRCHAAKAPRICQSQWFRPPVGTGSLRCFSAIRLTPPLEPYSDHCRYLPPLEKENAANLVQVPRTGPVRRGRRHAAEAPGTRRSRCPQRAGGHDRREHPATHPAQHAAVMAAAYCDSRIAHRGWGPRSDSDGIGGRQATSRLTARVRPVASASRPGNARYGTRTASPKRPCPRRQQAALRVRHGPPEAHAGMRGAGRPPPRGGGRFARAASPRRWTKRPPDGRPPAPLGCRAGRGTPEIDPVTVTVRGLTAGYEPTVARGRRPVERPARAVAGDAAADRWQDSGRAGAAGPRWRWTRSRFSARSWRSRSRQMGIVCPRRRRAAGRESSGRRGRQPAAAVEVEHPAQRNA